ncbi:hypothetical protein PHMEG_00023797 [Phytophthora megakarya]|uniref:Uncharacterized protein n=1 Tax=Phytophthora megakarya TaxID=4795 RepID=A0A225VH76_9STRA|nr:hypothetical protein PHMEG_00023797 [Phytophthora megakarya]
MKDVRREEEMEQGAWLEMYLSDISSPETRSCDYANEIDAPSVIRLEFFDSHVLEAGQNIVAEKTSAIVCPVPANSTSVGQHLNVGVMGPLKKKLSAEWLREKVSTTKRQKSVLEWLCILSERGKTSPLKETLIQSAAPFRGAANSIVSENNRLQLIAAREEHHEMNVFYRRWLFNVAMELAAGRGDLCAEIYLPNEIFPKAVKAASAHGHLSVAIKTL